MEPEHRKRPFSELESSEPTERAFERFAQFVPPHIDPKTTFELFLNKAGLELVDKYLDDLNNFSHQVPANVHFSSFCSIWHMFVARECSVKSMANTFQIQDNEDLKDQAVRLAFLRNHPNYFTDKTITVSNMIEALLQSSNEAAEQYISSLATKPDSEAITSRISLDIIKKGYDGAYMKSELIVLPILKKLRKQAASWIETAYHSPYTSLVAPSTSGKTRLLTELSKHVCVVYICLRDKDSTGQPPRSALASAMTPTTVVDFSNYYENLLIAIFEVVTDFFRGSRPDKGKVLKNWFDYHCPKNLEPEQPTQFSRDVLNKLNDCYSLIQSGKSKKASTRLKVAVNDMFTQTKFIDSSLTVLLAIDEARSLLLTPKQSSKEFSFFRNFRRALQHIPTNQGFFAILADTTSQVANFNPAPKNDPSARDEIDAGDWLFDPIYQISTLDVLVSPNLPRSWKELVSAARLVNYGSPVFGTYWRVAEAEGMEPLEIFDHIVRLAQSKLLCSTKQPLPAKLTKYQVLALLGPNIQPRLNGTLHLNSELVSSHAAHCNYISPGRDLIISNYPSQFTLACAANKILAGEEILIRCIKELTTILRLGLDAKGTAGELASRIILSCAMRNAMKLKEDLDEIPYGCSVRLADFLKALTGKPEEELQLGQNLPAKTRKELLGNGMVFWNHFTQIYYTPNSNELLHFLYRGLAVQCKPLQPGFDQLFTIYLKKGPDRLDEQNVTFCGVQVKNTLTQPSLVADNHKWTAQYSGIQITKGNPYLVLFMSLKTEGKTAPLPKGDKLRASQVFHGLKSFDCLTEEVVKALQEMIDVEPNIPSLHDDDDGERYANLINPLVYTRPEG
ncbi:hypothetical protein PGT21_017564 [Puccinia graminis f. sp. tritici]|uniref:Uncharacterized protein n=2 Tax=Puccinia graminis f. sp. tritici TaxID=56615 RepID=E3KUZ5_PUCGT|nr:uncharacterized protein PGTG_12542 [Puccinia graminis f. sp. tritici CRL 75-36-700-3]EFP88095.2 hypothetical protein PGTG_12542 [Puccinia graminis f. sp. tritici CRL 75-36-700-3]KAA1085726.1 hypothetical protein PGT21_017564 [Puccinia graminis f. sp. tritici]KAA1136136.1 hypothetical protein PGTUg99_033025 [Puccinia graminis f. sp. tritici]